VQYATTEQAAEAVQYWLDERWEQTEAGRLPVDDNAAENSMEDARSVTVGLSREETQRLLQEVPEVYHTQINDLLMTGLSEVLGGWTGARRVIVQMEGHGREEVSEGVEVSRTVGWFTTIYPVMLEVSGQRWSSSRGDSEVGAEAEEEIGREIKSIKEQMRRVPEKGIGYGVMRYLSRDEGMRESLERVGRVAQVSFNYLGQFDQVVGETRESSEEGNKVGAGESQGAGEARTDEMLFSMAGESSGAQTDMKNQRRQEIEINAMVVGGRLQVGWTYSAARYRRETIEEVAGGYVEALREIIRHCLGAGVGGYTPSDFGLTDLGQSELDKALDEIEFEIS
jgi:non-ribosomal peptide synthase protein (TIGR01720 family)